MSNVVTRVVVRTISADNFPQALANLGESSIISKVKILDSYRLRVTIMTSSED